MKVIKKAILIIPLIFGFVLGQDALPDDPPGNLSNLKTGQLDGNRIISVFQNNTKLGQGKNRGTGIEFWPSEYNATQISSETKFLVGAKVYLDADDNPIQDPDQTATAVDSIYFLESDGNQAKNGFAPVEGYYLEGSPTPAISDDPNTWPMTWPDVTWTNSEKYWNGRRGKNYTNSDLEAYFVANDASNKEHIDKYKPMDNDEWGGLGLRTEVRSLQWKQYPMDNTIIWEYEISNTSNYTLPDIFVGLYRDNGIGGDEYYHGEMLYIPDSMKTIFEWDTNFLPNERPDHPGVVGLTSTTTPDNSNDGLDNDGDGLADESQTNDAGSRVSGFTGVSNVPDFLSYFNFDSSFAEKAYWSGDEDRDWKDGTDTDGNGIYDYGYDSPGDDVGKDGIGPYDIGYEGPDEGEGNHMPDQGEPNFGMVDNDEGDQVGATKYSILDKNNFDSNYGFMDNKSLVDFLNDDDHNLKANVVSNYVQLLASDNFTFPNSKTTTFSYAEIHSADPLSGLMNFNNSFSAPDLFNRKTILDKVVSEDFQFMKPPVRPEVSASASDGRVTIVWDDIARQFGNQPFLNDINNFEGYKVYRATDANLQDALEVTDGYGVLFKYKPIAQYDLVNGKSQFVNYGAERGSGFFLGSDIGVKNFFIDNSVQNGVKYYYVVTAYNSGTYQVGDGVAPLESDFVLEPGNFSENVVAVTPRISSAGFKGAGIEVTGRDALGTGTVEPEIFVDANIEPGHEYKMVFESEEGPPGGSSYYVDWACIYRTEGFKIYDITDVEDDTSTGEIVYYENSKKYNAQNFYYDRYDDAEWNHAPDGWVVMDTATTLETASFDGLKVNFSVPSQVAYLDKEKTGWQTGSSPYNLQVAEMRYKKYMAFDYDIIFTDNDSAYTTVSNNTLVYDFNKEKIENVLFDQSYNFYVLNWSVTDSLGNPDTADIVTWDKNNNGEFDLDEDALLLGHSTYSRRGGWKFNSTLLAAILDFNDAESETQLPQPGDVFQIRYQRPFFDGDYVTFRVNGYDTEDPEKISSNMDKIQVVPNPYIFTNISEPAGEQGNWQRRMMFTHLPERCTIKIYTITGLLVDELVINNSYRESMSAGNVEDVGNGIAYWDLTNKDGKSVAPGYYIYRVTSEITGETIMDKFAIIK
ncbi:MAG: hypothetical protein K9N00_01700 [Candidatus Marinimicrobia bacterium]|nr:hypothetical protein [Candidatus Neomarinimicrobiota bacterium]